MNDTTTIVIRASGATLLSGSTMVVSTGTMGPQGPPGPSGAASSSFEFTQNTGSESAAWLINHNLGFNPNYSAEDDSGVPLIGQIIHHTVNQAELRFNIPRAGTARLS